MDLLKKKYADLQGISFFHPNGKEFASSAGKACWTSICSSRARANYTVNGTFRGEMEATKALLAAENGIQPEEITVKMERRSDSGKEIAK